MPSSSTTSVSITEASNYNEIMKSKEDSFHNNWTACGTFGSKNAVLLFKISALSKSQSSINREQAMISSTSSVDSSTFIKPTKKMIDAKNKISTTKFDLYRKRSLEHRNDSFSSSDNSISSACDDPTNVETQIANAEQQIDVQKTCEDHNDCQNYEEKSHNYLNELQEDEYISLMPASVLKITFKFINTETKLLKQILICHGLHEADENQNFNLLWTGLHLKPDLLRSLKPYQRVNHFPRSYELTRKDRLYKNIEKMQHLRGIKHFDIIPLSFMLPLEHRSLVTAHRTGHRGPWIVKPTASSRGRGIYLVNTPEQIPTDDQMIVSKYIADPLCIDGHKCDIRLYVVVTSFDPLIIYLYEEGLVRLATVKYDKNVENLWNPCMHLCNYSINKYHSDYIRATENDEDVGHKWTFSALLRHLKSQGCEVKQLMLNIENVIIKAIFSCTQSIVSACRMFVPHQNNCFELYGFDILIDNTLKPWLLEVNLSPSLGIDTPLDAKVKSSLLTDLLTLIGIPASNLMQENLKPNRSKNSIGRRILTEMNSTNKRMNNLPSEAIRMIRNVQRQYTRRGGFVRIFPVDDSMQRFSQFMDLATGVPMLIINSTSAPTQPTHNYNLILHNQIFGSKLCVGNLNERMLQYERPLQSTNIDLSFRAGPPKCTDKAQKLQKELRKSMESGNELTFLQARKIFSLFLEYILKRLSLEPKTQHEKIILKFITRADLSIKLPSFMKNPNSIKIQEKDRSAIVAKLLGDYIEAFNRDSDACIDNYEYYGLIPSQLIDNFILQAQECDLGSILSLHVNLTKNLSFLFNRFSTNVNLPEPPPIPFGTNGFLKALPNMTPSISTKDLAAIDTYYRSIFSSNDSNGDDDY